MGDLTVEDDHEPAVGRDHRLVGRSGGIDDGKPAVGEPDPLVVREPETGPVRATMGHRLADGDQFHRVHRWMVGTESEYSGYATHDRLRFRLQRSSMARIKVAGRPDASARNRNERSI